MSQRSLDSLLTNTLLYCELKMLTKGKPSDYWIFLVFHQIITVLHTCYVKCNYKLQMFDNVSGYVCMYGFNHNKGIS